MNLLNNDSPIDIHSDLKNTYQADIIIKPKNRFFPMLNNKQIENLENLENVFCVDSLENTKIFTIYRRDLRITKNLRDLFGLKEGYTSQDIEKNLKEKEVFVVRRDTINGIKQDDKYVIDKGIIKDIYGGLSYDNYNINIKINNKNELVSPDRIFISKKQLS